MREIKMPRGSKISLQPLYLTIEEEEERKDLYQKIVKSHFPSLREIDYKEYGELQKSLPNQDSEKILKDVALSIACNQLIYIFLHYNIKKIEFEDYLQDMYVLVEDKFQTYSNAKFLSEFKFFFENLTFRYVMSKCNKASRHNLDIYKSLMGKLDYNSDMDNISSNKYNTMEYNWLYSEFVEKVNKCLNTLSAKKKQLLIKYYGLNNTPNKNMGELGEEYGVTRSMIQREISQALKSLERCKDDDCLVDYKDGFEF